LVVGLVSRSETYKVGPRRPLHHPPPPAQDEQGADPVAARRRRRRQWRRVPRSGARRPRRL